MSANTIEENKSTRLFEEHSQVWLFAYGSILYKIDFDYLDKRPAHIVGWKRKFWQGSHDHRGTPSKPGRVVTLIEEYGHRCDGVALLITPEVFEHLDHREKNGYLRKHVDIIFDDGLTHQGLVYIADPENSAFLGHASNDEIAQQIAFSSGPSGSNADYLINLARALRELNAVDEHVFAIEELVHQFNNVDS